MCPQPERSHHARRSSDKHHPKGRARPRAASRPTPTPPPRRRPDGQPPCTGAEYLFGESVTAATETDAGVEVVLSGGQTRIFDLVIGADGLHSNTRALAFGPEEQFTRDLGYMAKVMEPVQKAARAITLKAY
ncbi:hypothetical protein ABZ924_03870 [Streptomyces sp. NPDC046876]|uniref:hypothetical protein n=1 Tax=Streptomyces sp. NPDC046876 TaxID=3155616 RepID=UPI0033C574EE